MQIFLDQSILHEDINIALKRHDQKSAWQTLQQFEIFRHLPVRGDGQKLFRAFVTCTRSF